MEERDGDRLAALVSAPELSLNAESLEPLFRTAEDGSLRQIAAALKKQRHGASPDGYDAFQLKGERRYLLFWEYEIVLSPACVRLSRAQDGQSLAEEAFSLWIDGRQMEAPGRRRISPGRPDAGKLFCRPAAACTECRSRWRIRYWQAVFLPERRRSLFPTGLWR